MRTRIILFTTAILGALQINGQIQVARENVIVTNQVHGYWEYLPADYETNSTKKYPLLVEWHGVGETGNGSLPALEMVRIHGLARVVRDGLFPQTINFNGQSYSFIVLNPQFIDPVLMSVLDIDAFLDYAFSHYRVDRNRVYMTGYSLGAMLSYQYAGLSNTFAQKITGIVPLSPCFDASPGLAQTIAANNVAVYGIHSNADVQCPTAWTVNWSNAINTANNGVPPTPASVYSLIPPPGPDPHDIFWATYEQNFSAPPVNKNIYEWMIQYARNLTLPVRLKNFSLENREGKVLVHWTSSSESNTREFRVGRAGKDLQFRDVAIIPAAGNSSVDKGYAWVDEFPQIGINYYRLHLVNLDNSSEYFQTKDILVSSASKLMLLSANPGSKFVRLSIDLERNQNVAIILLDIQGRIIHQRNAYYLQGTQQIFFSPTGIKSGTYFLKVIGENFVESKKIILQ